MAFRAAVLAIIGALALSACAHQAAPPPNAQHAAPRPLFPLAPPLGPPRRIVQQLTAHWPDQERKLLCVLELSGKKIAIAGLTPEGMSVFDLSYDGKHIEAERNPIVPDLVSPELIVADLQLVYWPLDVLRENLLNVHESAVSPRRMKDATMPSPEGSLQGCKGVEQRRSSCREGWVRGNQNNPNTFHSKTLRIEAGPGFRRLTENGQTRITVRYLSAETDWPRQVELTHLQYHYRLSIDTVSYEALPE